MWTEVSGAQAFFPTIRRMIPKKKKYLNKIQKTVAVDQKPPPMTLAGNIVPAWAPMWTSNGYYIPDQIRTAPKYVGKIYLELAWERRTNENYVYTLAFAYRSCLPAHPYIYIQRGVKLGMNRGCPLTIACR